MRVLLLNPAAASVPIGCQAPYVRWCCPEVSPDGKLTENRFRVRAFVSYPLLVGAKATPITDQIPVRSRPGYSRMGF